MANSKNLYYLLIVYFIALLLTIARVLYYL